MKLSREGMKKYVQLLDADEAVTGGRENTGDMGMDIWRLNRLFKY